MSDNRQNDKNRQDNSNQTPKNPHDESFDKKRQEQDQKKRQEQDQTDKKMK